MVQKYRVRQKELPYLEANKFKIEEDIAYIFLFLESTQNAVLYLYVLNKISLNWRLEYWYNNVASLGSCPWSWESFQL